MRVIVILLVLFCSCEPVLANMMLKVTTVTKCRVYVDGRYKGVTPALIDDLAPGKHELEVLDGRTGEYRLFRIYSPRSGNVLRHYDVHFDRPAKITESVISKSLVVEERAEAGVRTSEAQGVPRERVVKHSPSRQKVRRRNLLLGLGAANELFNHGNKHKRRRRDFRKGTIAATLLNELLTK